MKYYVRCKVRLRGMSERVAAVFGPCSLTLAEQLSARLYNEYLTEEDPKIVKSQPIFTGIDVVGRVTR